MKKFLSLLLVFLLCATVALAEEALHVYVSITDDQGQLALACQDVAVTDADADGALTINDALLCAHAVHHPKGAEAYQAVTSDYGLSMARLWDVENGGSYGYYLNDASAWSLADPIAEGDHIKAFCYTDLTAWSDTYAFFQAVHVNGKVNEPIALTLSAAGFDASYAPITLPVAGAVLTLQGEATDAVTDEQGCAALVLSQPGVYTVSAACEGMTLVAPVCIITVE